MPPDDTELDRVPALDFQTFFRTRPRVDRTCVFCGLRPKNKNNEHVLPKWLIKATGDPKRNVPMGYDYAIGDYRRLAFDQFTFPSCTECNDRFASKVETPAKAAIEGLIRRGALTRSCILSLLDWFDKVRIGLWLGFRYLNRNLLGISPNFHIAERIGQKDRLLMVYRTQSQRKGLTVVGADSLAFQLIPACFALCVNEYIFINLSTDFLIAERAGLPFISDLHYSLDQENDANLRGALCSGTGRLRVPLIDLPEFRAPSVTYFQSIVPALASDEPTAPPSARVVGPVYTETRFGTSEISDNIWREISLIDGSDSRDLFNNIAIGIYTRQSRFVDLGDGYDAPGTPADVKALRAEKRDLAKSLNASTIAKLAAK